MLELFYTGTDLSNRQINFTTNAPDSAPERYCIKERTLNNKRGYGLYKCGFRLYVSRLIPMQQVAFIQVPTERNDIVNNFFNFK